MKKVFLCILGLITCLVGGSQLVQADDLNVYTGKISNEITEKAKQNWENYLNGFLSTSGKKIDDFYLGHGFNIENEKNLEITAFPIIEKKHKDIKYILQISGESIILMQEFANQLNEVSRKQTLPITIGVEKENYVYKDNHKIISLVGESTSFSSANIFKEKEHTSINITEKLEDPNYEKEKTQIEHVLLPWTVYELQDSLPWCEYYVINTIVNNLAGKELMNTWDYIHEVHPGVSENDLSNEEWITKQSIVTQHNYLRVNYNISIKYDGNMFKSFDKVKNEIKTRKAPFVVDVNDTDGITHGHVLAQVGYTASNNENEKPYYYYWNPWWQDVFVVSSEAQYMQLGAYKYTPYRAQYNFSKPKLVAID